MAKSNIIRDNPEVEQILISAIGLAKKYNHSSVTVEHVFYGLITFPNFQDLLVSYGVDYDGLLQEAESYVAGLTMIEGLAPGDVPKKTPGLERIFNKVLTQVIFGSRDIATLADVYIAILNEVNSYASYLLIKYGLSDKLKFIDHYNKNYVTNVTSTAKSSGGSKNSSSKSVLEEYCTDLTKLALEGKIDPVIGREVEITEIYQTLSKRQKNNVLMIGDPGVGKTAVVEGLAVKLSLNQVPDNLKGHSLYSLEVGSLLAGSKYRGDFEEKVKEIIEALIGVPAILFVDEGHQVKGAGALGGGGPDLSNMLKPAISRGKIKVIMSTTWEEVTKSFEKDRAFMRRFHKLAINEPTSAVSIEILKGIKGYYEKFHHATISDEAIESAVMLSARYILDRKLPDKAIDLIDDACARKRIEDKVDYTINEDDILDEVSRVTKIPVGQLSIRGSKKVDVSVDDIESNLKRKIFGQDQVVDGIMKPITISKAGLKDPNKPIASFLFTGPTGTGKTEMVKQLALELGLTMVRFDMSEFMEKHTVSRLIGAPPGYVGFGEGNLEGGLLIAAAKKNPYSIILFDEVDKAHPDLTDILLQIMDHGKITGSNGEVADFKNSIIVMTCNLGARENEKELIGIMGSSSNTERTEDDKAIMNFFRPEFRNRLSGIFKFKKLTTTSMKLIVAKFINALNDLMADKHIKVRIDSSVEEFLLRKGFDDKMGARPLDRAIEQYIKYPLSRKLLVDNIADYSIIKTTMSQKDDSDEESVAFEIVAPLENTDPAILETETLDDNGFIQV